MRGSSLQYHERDNTRSERKNDENCSSALVLPDIDLLPRRIDTALSVAFLSVFRPLNATAPSYPLFHFFSPSLFMQARTRTRIQFYFETWETMRPTRVESETLHPARFDFCIFFSSFPLSRLARKVQEISLSIVLGFKETEIFCTESSVDVKVMYNFFLSTSFYRVSFNFVK